MYIYRIAELKIYIIRIMDRVKSGNFGPVEFFGTPISFMGFMSTSYDYQSND